MKHAIPQQKKRPRWINYCIATAGVLTLMGAPMIAFGQTDRFGLEYGTGAGLGTRDVRATIATLINVALGILGIVMLIIILVAGGKWMMAAGSEDQVAEAKKSIGQAVIGLLVVFVAFAIAKFVFSVLERST